MATTQEGVSYNLFIRADRPIEGCDLTPVPYLQQKGAGNDRARLLDSNSYYFTYVWRRGPKKAPCVNSQCPRGLSFDPMHWSKAAIGGPELICNVCTSAGYPAHEACFCSKQCFVAAWKDHSRRHSLLRCMSTVSDADASSTSSEGADEEEGEETEAAGGFESTPATPANNTDREWTYIADEKAYVPTAEDIGCRLRIDVYACSATDNSILAGPVMLVTEPVLTAPIKAPKRALQTISGSGAGIAGAVRFRIISYNVLAEIYSTRQAYPYVDSWNLAWPFRRKLIFEELEEAAGDIVCLQEVQADHYDQDFAPFMSSLGYDGIYKSKSREYGGQYGKVDGCATFWKKSKFMMTENYSLDFNDLARQEASNMGFDETDARKYINRLNRDNIAQIVVLEALQRSSRSPGRSSLCIVNTHIYSNYQRGDVKLWQTLSLLREIQSFVTARDLALLICGDFNSEPHSAVYDFITHGALQQEAYAYPDLNSDTKVKVLPDLHMITHELDLQSAVATGLGAEPKFTNYTQKFKGTLDYIFYTPSRLRVMAVTSVPEEHEVAAVAGGGLPCVSYPSDHMYLSCDVALIGTGNILHEVHGSGKIKSRSMGK